MRKLSLFLVLVLTVSLLSGCAGTPVVYYSDCTCPTGSHDTVVAPTETIEETHAPVAEGSVKTGLAICGNISTADASAEAEGSVEYDVSVVAVLVDDNGVIVDCVIDSIGATASFDTAGAVTSADAEVLTKNELGYDYNMLAYTGGAAVGEWFEQAEALANYAVGKTVEELKTGAVGETGYAQDADLATSATIYLGGYVSAIEVAVTNAKHLGAQAGDELKLASTNALSGANLTTDAVALTVKDGVITSCYLDSLQADATVNEDGTAVAGNTLTKNEKGYDYGMVNYAGSTYEWFEQAENFCAYVTGKTAAEVAGIAIDEGTKPTDADLVSSVTIAIGGFQNLIAKAAASGR